MSKTRHIQKRMNQRGIEHQLIDVATKVWQGRALQGWKEDLPEL